MYVIRRFLFMKRNLNIFFRISQTKVYNKFNYDFQIID